MKQKGFSLIELLVVVAIIGILAAVGVVAYNGYTKAAKANATKTNHQTIVKYIKTETLKCAIGEAMAMDNELNCADVSCGDSCNWSVADKVAIATEKALTKAGLKNPYFPDEIGVRVRGGNSVQDIYVGYVVLDGQYRPITVNVCFKLPCSVQENRLSHTVNTYE